MLIEVLLHRQGAKKQILEVVKDMIRPKSSTTLTIIGEVFNRLNQVSQVEQIKKD